MFLDFAEAFRVTVNGDFIFFLILIIFVFHTIVYQIEYQFIHIKTLFLFECENAFVVKKERKTAGRSHISAELIED